MGRYGEGSVNDPSSLADGCGMRVSGLTCPDQSLPMEKANVERIPGVAGNRVVEGTLQADFM